MLQTDRCGASGFSRKVLVGSALVLPAVVLLVAVAGFHGPASAGPAQTESRSPENPLRSVGTVAASSPLPEAPHAKSVGEIATGTPAVVPAPAGKISEAPAAGAVGPGQHPLDPALAEAERISEYLRKNVKDYTCTVVKQERIGGTLNPPEFMAAKIRQQPFSAYLRFLRPEEAKGREVIYVAGANEGNLVAREGSGFRRAIGFVLLKPAGLVAMQDNRYPITELGISNLIDRLIEVGRQDRKYAESEVHFYKNAKVNGRVCTLIEASHPVPRANFRFHKARIYIDDELHVPIRYEAYQWPKQPGGEPPLDEAYTYLDLKLNVGLTDADFDYRNQVYHFVDK
jgi:hypothetical protein